MRRQSVFVGILLLTCVFIGYVATGPGLFYWKENFHHYESGVRASLLALHAMQENYKQDHGEYAGALSQLGAPLGASFDGEALTWSGPYRFRITQSVRNQNEKVVKYSIEARPTLGAADKYPILHIDEAGNIAP